MPTISVDTVRLLAKIAFLVDAAADGFDAKIGAIGPGVGAKKPGYDVTAVPTGKSTFSTPV